MGGVTKGLISLDQEVEWRAKHFGLGIMMRVRVTRFQRPTYFQDAMLRGPFGSFVHDHIFETQNSGTMMIDKIVLHSPFSIIGRMADFLVLGRYMRRFIQSRNARLKAAAESSVWRDYLPIQNL